jgi:hypothetical protein
LSLGISFTRPVVPVACRRFALIVAPVVARFVEGIDTRARRSAHS